MRSNPMYRLMLTSSANNFLVSLQQFRAATQTQAEARAINLLRARRLMSEEGNAWDRWDLGVKPAPRAGWVHVAHGDWRDTIETTRQRSERELADGLA